MRDSKIVELIIQKLEGIISGKDIQILDGVSEDKRKAIEKEINDIREVSSKIKVKAPNLDDAWEEFSKKINVEDLRGANSRGGARRSYGYWKIAASVILIAGIFWITRHYSLINQWHEVQSGNRIVNVMLPDNSQVWLNRFSTLKYSKTFGKTERKLELLGEAFFEVSPDPDKPFIIKTHHNLTEVVGTSFNLRAHGLEPITRIDVITGKVRFSTPGIEEVWLLPGNTAEYHTGESTIRKFLQEDINFIAWKTGLLKFDSHPLSRVKKWLEDYYHVEIEIESDIANCRYSASFQDASIEEIIEIMTITFGFEVEGDSTKIVLNGGACN